MNNSRSRKIRMMVKSQPTMEGAGVHLHRAFGGPRDARLFDPFLLMDDFRNDHPADYAPGFPWHPHRGIETITYVLAGRVEHRDSMGNKGVIGAGDVQWMTAGNGIQHQEMPEGDPDGRMYGFQLWANLPAANKMMAPRYQDVLDAQIPTVDLEGGAKARVICGEVNGVRGPVEDIVIDPQYLDIAMPAGTRLCYPTPSGYTVLAYVTEGEVRFEDDVDEAGTEEWADNRTLVLFEDGEQVTAQAGEQGARFLLISGRPIQEPVAWYGPIVMNTQAELRQAVEDLQNGTFIKKR